MSEAKPLKQEKCETYDAGYSKEDLMPKKDSQNPCPQPYEIGKWYLIENHDDDTDDIYGDTLILLFSDK